MTRTACRRNPVLALALLCALCASAVCQAAIECYPCRACMGKVCFIIDKYGNTIGEVGSSCCGGGGNGNGAGCTACPAGS